MTEVLYFGGQWCGPCKSMKPMVQEVCQLRNHFLREYDVDKNPTEARENGVFSIPTIIRIDNGNRLTGLQSRSKLDEFLK